ncbi:hypothetical protein [Peribacillus sp. NPDC096448]|uniref:hypothetical protein n=1 Tax=Peribacillus sp. NPDC096448 TaxID=3364395 RepID=UPI0038213E42
MLRKTVCWTHPEPSLRPGYPSCCFIVTLNGWKKYATLLPNNWLAETPQPFTGEEAWQTVGGKGADF